MENEEIIPSFIANLFYLANNKIGKIVILSMVLIFVNIIIFIVNYMKSKINTKFNLRINRNVKQIVLEHIPKLEYMEFNNINKSDVIQRVNNDATTYSEFFNSQINLFFDTIFIIIFAVAQTLELNVTVGIFIGVICLLIVILSIWFFKSSKPLVEDIVERNKQVIEKTTINVENSKMVKIYNKEQKEIQDFKNVNDEYRKKDVKLAKLKVWYRITTHSLRNFKEPFILLWGGILVVKGELTIASLSILLAYATKIMYYVYDTVARLENINEFIVAYKKLSRLMKYKEDVEKNPDIKLSGDIIFKNVSIKIQENKVLEDINFTIKQGENIAIIGDNGSGKTIIAKTLIGFYEYTGDIYIGEWNIKKVSKKSLRNYIGVVLQDTFLFTDTVKNNININQNKISDEQIINVCKMTELYDDIKRFDNNINYLIGKGGNNISGGQKQRIAIARTILLDNKFIIFDDSLSKLDSKTKVKILNNIIQMQKGTIIISHDIEVVQKCDKVLFINNKSVKVSTHEDLLENDEQYRQIIEINQNKIFEDED